MRFRKGYCLVDEGFMPLRGACWRMVEGTFPWVATLMAAEQSLAVLPVGRSRRLPLALPANHAPSCPCFPDSN